MVTRLLFTGLFTLLLASCTGQGAASTQRSITEPAPLVTPTPTENPAAYSTSLLVTRWDRNIGHHMLLPVDPTSGKQIPGYEPIDLGVNYSHIFSPDRRTLAIISYISDSPTHPLLHIIDLEEWKEETLQLDLTGWSNTLDFSPDGSMLAASFTYRDTNLVIFDLEENAIQAQIEADFNLTRIHFAKDGTALMAYGNILVDRFTENERSQGNARVALYHANDLRLLWTAEAAGLRDGIYPVDAGRTTELHQPGNGIYLYPGVVFVPGTDKLYAVHADEEKLTQVDFADRSVKTVNLTQKLSWFEHFLMLGTGVAHAKVANGTSLAAVISPDGEVIYTTGRKYEAAQQTGGDWKYKSTPLGLRAIRVSDGRLLFEKDVNADWLSMASDGSRLFLFGWGEGDASTSPSTDIFDLKSYEVSLHIDGAQLSPTRRMDGNLVLVSSMTISNSSEATRMSVHDYRTGELIAEWISPTYAGWITAP